MKYDLEKTVSTDQAFFFKTSCFGIIKFSSWYENRTARVCMWPENKPDAKHRAIKSAVQSNQKICYAASVESRGFPGGVSPK